VRVDGLTTTNDHRGNMNKPRREFLRLAVSAGAFSVLPGIVLARNYPARPVHLLVGYAPGGAADTLARIVGQALSQRLGQTFVVENRTGAGGNIATEAVIRAPADGYTLLVNATPNIVSAPLDNDFDISRDTMPIGGISRGYLVMLVHPSVPAKNLGEFIAYAKANPGKMTMSSAGNGTPPHMAGELFKIMADVDIVHIPYRGGGPALVDLLGGQVQLMFSNLPADEYVATGKLRALAVTTAVRAKTMPDVPTIGEFVSGYEASVAFGLCGPKDLPADIIEPVNQALNASLADPSVQAKLANLGAMPLILPPAGFKQFLADETPKWNKVARAAKILPN
jgi:tripartite-type tricarboxylate transporter receptor subunit TctC